MGIVRNAIGGVLALALAMAANAARPDSYDERPAQLKPATAEWNFERRIVDIPMRDGVKLHTVILVPKGAREAPMLLTRTPYNAERMASQQNSGDLGSVIDGYDSAPDVVIEGGYIRVIQDVRGKYGSGGTYVMNRPFAGTAFNPTKVDHSTDAYDTIEWLVRHVPESNRRVGIIGISYDGFTALAALVNPHPALKVAVPMNPMVDGWVGDDWFHNGAFTLPNMSYIWEQVATRDNSEPWIVSTGDQYDFHLRAGSAGALATRQGLDQIGFWQKILAHPAYDDFWQGQAMDRVLAAQPLKTPVMIVHSLWDQEDLYGAPAVYRAIKPKDLRNDMVYLSMGPWNHGQEIGEASNLGAIKFGSDTGKWWRKHVLAPFLAHFLKDMPMSVAPVTAFETGTNEWRQTDAWPIAGAGRKLWLQPGLAVGFDQPPTAETADYVSDPRTPVTYQVRPIKPMGYEGNPWPDRLVDDQRAVSARPDVLTFTGPVLTRPLRIAGRPFVHLTASTSGSDSDWVVKLIDVYPDQMPGDRAMAGYQLPIGMEIFRGRYRESLSSPTPLVPNMALKYRFALPEANHVFLPGHRIMVQVQSSCFPLFDRNPQKYVPNIFLAKPEDYVSAAQKVTVGGADGSYIELPIAE